MDGSEILSEDHGDSCWTGLINLAPQVFLERHELDAFCGSIGDEARRTQCADALIGNPPETPADEVPQ